MQYHDYDRSRNSAETKRSTNDLSWYLNLSCAGGHRDARAVEELGNFEADWYSEVLNQNEVSAGPGILTVSSRLREKINWHFLTVRTRS
jgi:hypothetical protein